MINEKISKLIQECLEDIKVELGDEFDRNFERQAFFTEAWAKRKIGEGSGKGILQDTGALRKSILSKIDNGRITFYSELDYAEIHNNGGSIKVTKKMKGYFWHKYKESMGMITYKKNEEVRNTQRNRVLTSEQAFYKGMACKRVGSLITIPQRKFIGKSPEVEKLVLDVVTDKLDEFFKDSSNYKVDIKYTEK
jgi:phage gpG-like protein